MTSDRILEAVQRVYPGSDVVSVRPLKGGMSAEMQLLELRMSSGETVQVVARTPGEYVHTLFEDPAAQEFRTLSAVSSMGLPAPKPLGLGENLLLLQYLPGKPTANPSNPADFLQKMAQALANIHNTDISQGNFDFLLQTKPTYAPPSRELSADLREPELVAAAIASLPDQGGFRVPRILQNQNRRDAKATNTGVTCLRHGDFWPGNLLWQDGNLTGIIDWENALLGPSIADLAISRLDVYWILGREAMETFTEAYLQINPIDLKDLRYWDIRAALRPMSNLGEWAGPYADLDRPDITPEYLRESFLEFIALTL